MTKEISSMPPKIIHLSEVIPVWGNCCFCPPVDEPLLLPKADGEDALSLLDLLDVVLSLLELLEEVLSLLELLEVVLTLLELLDVVLTNL